MKYLVSDIEAWRDEIAALPGPEPGSRKVGKSEAIGLVAKELQAALQRGLSTSELVEFLSAKGLKVHEDTLRLAMRKVGRRAGAGSGKGRRPSGATRRGAPVAEGAGGAKLDGEPRDRANGDVGDQAGGEPRDRANGDVGDQAGGGRSEERSATEAERGGPAERNVEGEAANADGGRADAGPIGAAGTTVIGKVVRPEDRSGEPPTLVPSAAAFGPVPGATPATSSQTKAPAAAGGRGTFTPRSDSNDL